MLPIFTPMKTFYSFFVVFCFVLFAGTLRSEEPAKAPIKPNIILIMSDDMGYSDLGCYGSEISTPNLDQLASGGIRFTQFYNTARCCPTRASLLTGLHPHQAGIGHMMENRQLPGYTGELSPNSMTIAEVLRPAGYATYGVGKWHVTHQKFSDENRSNWPAQRGFDKYYGIVTGATNYFEPATLIRNDTPISHLVDPEYQPEGSYYLTDAISDNAAKYVREHAEGSTDKPFFMYVAYTAAHWPMQALPEDIAKYKGKYDAGYEPIREARFERMRQMGLLDPAWELTPQADDWNGVKNKDWEAACMETYAAMIDNMDRGIGRIVDSLKETDQYENTVILFLQDNGACAENAGRGSRKDFPTRVDKPVFEAYPPEKTLHQREETDRTRDGYPVIHGPNVMPGPKDTFIAYGRGWANVSNTPFREYKHWVHEGGISTPLIVHAPSRIHHSLNGMFCHEYGQLVDVMATCVDLAGAKYPQKHNNNDVTPMQGTSLVPAMTGKPLARKSPLFWEHEGNRAVRDGRWKLVAKGPQGAWELYDVEKDRSEMHDLAQQHSEIVEQMVEQWLDWAARAKVLPWPWGTLPTKADLEDGIKFELLFAENGNTVSRETLADTSGMGNRFDIRGELRFDNGAVFDGKSRIEVTKSSSLYCANTPWHVEAETLAKAPSGVIVSQGGLLHGYSLFLRDGKPGFAVRIDGKSFSVLAPEKADGWSKLSGTITPDKKIVLAVNGKTVAEKEIPDFIADMPGETLIVGADLAGLVFESNLPAFSGIIKRIAICRGMPSQSGSLPERIGQQ